jgi:hypothetical protein
VQCHYVLICATGTRMTSEGSGAHMLPPGPWFRQTFIICTFRTSAYERSSVISRRSLTLLSGRTILRSSDLTGFTARLCHLAQKNTWVMRWGGGTLNPDGFYTQLSSYPTCVSFIVFARVFVFAPQLIR